MGSRLLPSTAPHDPPAGCLAVLDDVPATGAACREGRLFVAERLREWQVPEAVIDVAVLVTSELVANAVNYGPPPGRLRVHLDQRRVRIEVGDANPRPPQLMVPGDTIAGGRGLLLIDRLSTRWGWEPGERGKTVWCEVTIPG